MIISGLQKLTLLDYPNKVACTVFTGGCNFRCPFCHNASLVVREFPEMPKEELIAFLKKRTGILDGVCITGGEPMLHPDLADLIREIKDLGYCVKLDTNGSYPDRLEAVLKAGIIDHVAMDVKNSREKYAATVGIEGFDLAPIDRSIKLILSSGVPYTFRTTLCHPFHTAEDVESICKWIAGADSYNLQTFVDSGDLIGSGITPFTKDETNAALAIARSYIPNSQIKGQ